MPNDHLSKTNAWLVISGVFLLAIDSIFKNFFIGSWASDRFSFWKGNIELALQKNEGISYGLAVNEWLVISSSMVILAGLFFFVVRSARKKEYVFVAPLLIILFGALSNLFDRLYRGFVIDYLHLLKIISFNIADLLILGGAIWLIISYLKMGGLTKTRRVDNL